MCGWMGGKRFWRIWMSQLPTRLKLKLSIAILKNTFSLPQPKLKMKFRLSLAKISYVTKVWRQFLRLSIQADFVSSGDAYVRLHVG